MRTDVLRRFAEREQPGVAFNRKHADTLALMPMQEKMKAFESASDDSRRNFWLQRAEEKKALAAKPKAPKVRRRRQRLRRVLICVRVPPG